MRKRLHEVRLTAEERQELQSLTSRGEVQVRVYKRARILLLADEGHKDAQIMERVGVSRATVSRIRQRYGVEGVGAVAEKARPGRPSIFDGETRVKITALACSNPKVARAGTCGCWRIKL